MVYLASDPLGNGANMFGTSGYQIDYHIISYAAIWYVQVAALLSRPRGRAGARARPRAGAVRGPRRGGAQPVLDARGDGRVHELRAVAAVRRRDLSGAGLRYMWHGQSWPQRPASDRAWRSRRRRMRRRNSMSATVFGHHESSPVTLVLLSLHRSCRQRWLPLSPRWRRPRRRPGPAPSSQITRERQPDQRSGLQLRLPLEHHGVTPKRARAQPAGARVRRSAADDNHTGQTVTIYGYEGEPYARVLANGTAEEHALARRLPEHELLRRRHRPASANAQRDRRSGKSSTAPASSNGTITASTGCRRCRRRRSRTRASGR